ncbi:regulatory protein, luxR family [Modicisalibacter muralis]|uniref:Regulatory protein, luxR family n=1 Tax=Modicisalibacter muralis TaxID=119000 RepID=A0A1G9MWD6_9GAMM|nr:helix-turn-helix transcriptional regulator [Halomonas muralis]SDL78592.1 regulatory protein, luxR family [Halomonas muralis]
MKPITQRQAMLTALAARGMGCKEIAGEVGIAVNTVRATLQQARERTNSKSITHLVAKALSRGWITPLCLALALSMVMDTGTDKLRVTARVRLTRTTTRLEA